MSSFLDSTGLSRLVSKITDYFAKKDGTYPDMTVGNVSNVVPIEKLPSASSVTRGDTTHVPTADAVAQAVDAISKLAGTRIGNGSQADLNDCISGSESDRVHSYYWVYSQKANVSHKPTDDSGQMLSMSYDNNNAIQIVITGSGVTYSRSKVVGTWSDWFNIRDASWINSGTFDAARIPTIWPDKMPCGYASFRDSQTGYKDLGHVLAFNKPNENYGDSLVSFDVYEFNAGGTISYRGVLNVGSRRDNTTYLYTAYYIGASLSSFTLKIKYSSTSKKILIFAGKTNSVYCGICIVPKRGGGWDQWFNYSNIELNHNPSTESIDGYPDVTLNATYIPTSNGTLALQNGSYPNMTVGNVVDGAITYNKVKENERLPVAVNGFKSLTASDGDSKYVKICSLKMSSYMNNPIRLAISTRRSSVFYLDILPYNTNSNFGSIRVWKQSIFNDKDDGYTGLCGTTYTDTSTERTYHFWLETLSWTTVGISIVGITPSVIGNLILHKDVYETTKPAGWNDVLEVSSVVKTGRGSAIGSASNPVYINTQGYVVACNTSFVVNPGNLDLTTTPYSGYPVGYVLDVVNTGASMIYVTTGNGSSGVPVNGSRRFCKTESNKWTYVAQT